MKLALDAD